MFENIKRHAREFSARRSGTRFQSRFRNRSPDRTRAHVIFIVLIAIALVPIGLVMLVLPGPGLAFLVLAAALLAGESLLVARALDRVDLTLSRMWSRLRR